MFQAEDMPSCASLLTCKVAAAASCDIMHAEALKLIVRMAGDTK